MDEKSNFEFEPDSTPPDPKPASAERSGVIFLADRAQPSASNRARLIPSDHIPMRWWTRHRRRLHVIEWGAAFIFFLVALYYLWLLLFTVPEKISEAPRPPPTRTDFHERLRALPPVVPDAAWKVAARTDRWRGIVVHHTATNGGSVGSIDKYHKEKLRYENGLAYHFLIGNGNGMADGEVAIGPRWQKQETLNGAHVIMTGDAKKNLFDMPENADGNSFSIGIALVGNFEEDLPTAKQLAALKGLLNFLRTEYAINLRGIVGHGQVKNTLCPGKFFYIDDVVLALANP